MDIKLIACDLDGTLMGADLRFSPRLRHAVQRAQEQGIIVTLATGRGYPSTRQFAHHLGITVPLICYQGAQIRDLDGTVLYESTLPRKYLCQVVEFCRTDGWELTAYHDDQIYQTTWQYNRAYYDRWFGLPIHKVDDLMTALPGDPLKFIAIAPTQRMGDQLEQEIRRLAGTKFLVMRSHVYFVEGIAANVSKGNSIARLARRLGIVREQVLAIGDSGNDASMVEWAGLGIAMGNASADVKTLADVIAPSQAEDGAAWAIEHYALETSG